jgi:hypothetical protein
MPKSKTRKLNAKRITKPPTQKGGARTDYNFWTDAYDDAGAALLKKARDDATALYGNDIYAIEAAVNAFNRAQQTAWINGPQQRYRLMAYQGPQLPELRNNLWTIRRYANDDKEYDKFCTTLNNLINTGAYLGDYSNIPVMAAATKALSAYNQARNMIDITTTGLYLNGKEQLDAMEKTIYGYFDNLSSIGNSYRNDILSINSQFSGDTTRYVHLSYPNPNSATNALTQAKTLITDNDYNDWVKSGATTYPTNIPTDDSLVGTVFSSVFADADANAKYYAALDARIQSFKKNIDDITATLTTRVAGVMAQAKPQLDLIAPILLTAKLTIFKLRRLLMGLVPSLPPYTYKPALFVSMPAPNTNTATWPMCMYIDLTTYKIYDIDFPSFKDSEIVTNITKACIEFSDKRATVSSDAEVIAALPNNTFVQALLKKKDIMEKVSSITMSDVVNDSGPAFTGYGKFINKASYNATDNPGGGIIYVTDSTGNPIFNDGALWKITGIQRWGDRVNETYLFYPDGQVGTIYYTKFKGLGYFPDNTDFGAILSPFTKAIYDKTPEGIAAAAKAAADAKAAAEAAAAIKAIADAKAAAEAKALAEKIAKAKEDAKAAGIHFIDDTTMTPYVFYNSPANCYFVLRVYSNGYTYAYTPLKTTMDGSIVRPNNITNAFNPDMGMARFRYYEKGHEGDNNYIHWVTDYAMAPPINSWGYTNRPARELTWSNPSYDPPYEQQIIDAK